MPGQQGSWRPITHGHPEKFIRAVGIPHVQPLDWWDDEAPDGTVDGYATKLSRLQAGEQFAYVFDMGDDWAHLCKVADKRIDPLDELGEAPDRPVPYGGWGPPGPVRTPSGRG